MLGKILTGWPRTITAANRVLNLSNIIHLYKQVGGRRIYIIPMTPLQKQYHGQSSGHWMWTVHCMKACRGSTFAGLSHSWVLTPEGWSLVQLVINETDRPRYYQSVWIFPDTSRYYQTPEGWSLLCDRNKFQMFHCAELRSRDMAILFTKSTNII